MSTSSRSTEGTAAVRELKRLERARLREMRDAIPSDERHAASDAICREVLNGVPYRYAKRILMYSPVGSETDVNALFAAALSDGKEVYFPKTEGKGIMRFYRVTDGSCLVKGKFGILSPDGTTDAYDTASGSDHDLCIVPALGYDKDGFRIGYGGGYYDRFLASFCGIRAGVCFEALVKRDGLLPREKRYDKKTDVLYTEQEVTVFGI